MQALTYHGRKDVRVETVPDPVVAAEDELIIACGECFHCQLAEYAACETTNPVKGAALNAKGLMPPAALFGYSHLYGGLAGGQAEFVRVPKANVGPLRIPEGVADEQVPFLSDILPTGFQVALNAGVKAGLTVAIYGVRRTMTAGRSC